MQRLRVEEGGELGDRVILRHSPSIYKYRRSIHRIFFSYFQIVPRQCFHWKVMLALFAAGFGERLQGCAAHGRTTENCITGACLSPQHVCRHKVIEALQPHQLGPLD